MLGSWALTELAVLPGESWLAGAGARGGVAVAAVAGAGVGAALAPVATAAGCQGKQGHIQHHPAALPRDRTQNTQHGTRLSSQLQHRRELWK